MSEIAPSPSLKQQFFGLQYTHPDGLDHVMRLINTFDPSEAQEFKYVVTPNADHILRVMETPALLDVYNAAWLCLNDSRVIQLLLRIGGFDLPVVRGSDLATELLTSQWIRGKRVIVIGGDERVSLWLNSLSGPETVFHYNPPMGFIRSSEALDNVIRYIERHLPAVVFLAVGSPNQEIVAGECRRRGLRGGLAFCIGAGILMAAGIEHRAPPLLRFAGLEWMYRLARDPRRLASRYLRDFRIFSIVAREVFSGHSVAH